MQMVKIQIPDKKQSAKAFLEMSCRGRILCFADDVYIVPEPALDLLAHLQLQYHELGRGGFEYAEKALRDAQSKRRYSMDILNQTDPEIYQAIQGERQRQQQGLEMIASENYTAPPSWRPRVRVLTNKYAEGYPGKRYYGGCEFVDVAEASPSNACQEALWRRARQRPAPLRRPGQHGRVLRLPQAGRHHPGHGPRPRRPSHARHELNFSGKYYKIVRYGVAGRPNTSTSTSRPVWPESTSRKW